MNIEKVIVDELKHFYPDINDGEKMYSERVAKIKAEELIEYSKQLTQKIFEAAKNYFLKHDCLGVIYVREVEEIEIEDLELN